MPVKACEESQGMPGFSRHLSLPPALAGGLHAKQPTSRLQPGFSFLKEKPAEAGSRVSSMA